MTRWVDPRVSSAAREEAERVRGDEDAEVREAVAWFDAEGMGVERPFVGPRVPAGRRLPTRQRGGADR